MRNFCSLDATWYLHRFSCPLDIGPLGHEDKSSSHQSKVLRMLEGWLREQLISKLILEYKQKIGQPVRSEREIEDDTNTRTIQNLSYLYYQVIDLEGKLYKSLLARFTNNFQLLESKDGIQIPPTVYLEFGSKLIEEYSKFLTDSSSFETEVCNEYGLYNIPSKFDKNDNILPDTSQPFIETSTDIFPKPVTTFDVASVPIIENALQNVYQYMYNHC